MKVYIDDCGEKRLIGRADVPDEQVLVYEVSLFGANSTITEQFMLGVITHLAADGADPFVERAVLLAPGQQPELLPGWQPLAS